NLEEGLSDYQMYLRNGIATLTIKIPKKAKVGEIYHYKSIVKDRFHEDNPFNAEFEIEIFDEPNISSKGSKATHLPPGKSGDGRRRKSDDIDFLRIEQIWKENWGPDDNEFTVIRATPINGKFDLKINMDNSFFLHEVKIRKLSKVELEAKYIRGMYLISLSLLQKDNRTAFKLDEDGMMTKGDLVGNVTRAVAPVILPIMLDL
ncbi:MAG: hypothetical protein ACTSWQ_10750, partial [Candidatus Thorarchaeota archaeon]